MHTKRAICAVVLIMLLCVQAYGQGSANNAIWYQESFLKPNGLIYRAARLGNSQEIGRLLERGCSVNTRNEFTKPLLTVAVERGHRDLITLLLQQGADVSLTDSKGNTALMYAVINNQVKIAKSLLEHGANPWIEGEEWKSPFAIALLRNRKLLIELFLIYGLGEGCDNYLERAMRKAVVKGDIDIVRLLLESGVNPNAIKNGCSALVMARGREERYAGSFPQAKSVYTAIRVCLSDPLGYIGKKQDEIVQCFDEAMPNMPTDLARCIARMIYFLNIKKNVN